MSKFRVLITGGGSGGHIYPIIAVVVELQLEAAKKGIDLELRYLGAYGSYKTLLEDNNVRTNKIIESKVRRYSTFLNIFEIPKFIFGVIQALWNIYWFMPDVLFSKGGPGALPVVLSAWFYRIPIVIHESDSVPGLTNVISAKYAKTVATSFAGGEKYFGKKNILAGNPVRNELIKNVKFDKAQEKRRFKFDPNKPLLLVIGGSLGSTRINDFIINNLLLILEVAQVFHQTGKDNYEVILDRATKILAPMSEEVKSRYKVVPYFDEDMGDAYMASDIVVGRAGAGSIFEIAAFKKPSILIPLPESAQDHQRFNAFAYESQGAGYMIEESNLLPNLFLDKVINMLSNPEKYKSMRDAAGSFFRPDAALNLANIILSLRDGR